MISLDGTTLDSFYGDILTSLSLHFFKFESGGFRDKVGRMLGWPRSATFTDYSLLENLRLA